MGTDAAKVYAEEIISILHSSPDIWERDHCTGHRPSGFADGEWNTELLVAMSNLVVELNGYPHILHGLRPAGAILYLLALVVANRPQNHETGILITHGSRLHE